MKGFASSQNTLPHNTEAISSNRMQGRLTLVEQNSLQPISESTPGIAVIDSELRYVQVSDWLARLHGLPAGEHLGKTVREVVPQLASTVEPVLERILATGEPAFNIELQGEAAGEPGVLHRWKLSYIPLSEDGGKPHGICVLVSEITKSAHSPQPSESRKLVAVEEAAPDKKSLQNRIHALKDVALALATAAEVLEEAEESGRMAALDVESGIDFDEEVRSFEVHLITRALKQTRSNQKQAARLLKMKHTTLHTKIKRYGIALPANDKG
jgi:PAS domain S-box-containing protein